MKIPPFVVEGAKLEETPLRDCQPDPTTTIKIKAIKRDRKVMFRCLDDRFRFDGFVPICMDTNDGRVVQSAYAKRLLRPLDKPLGVNLARLDAFVRRFLATHVKKNLTILSFDEWLAGTSYNEARKLQLRDAFDKNVLTGGKPTIRKAHKVESHVKEESYVEYKHARTINSRPDVFKAWFGPICKTIEHEVYGLKYFVKEKTLEQRVEQVRALKGKLPYCFSTDFTAFESHFTPAIMQVLEFNLYRHCLAKADYDYLIKVIGGRNKLRMRYGHGAECDGRRMSGEMSTSLANGFSNLMLALFIAEERGGALDGVVEGDDGLFVTNFIMNDCDYKNLGFTIKICKELDPCTAQFCGLVFGDDGNVIKDPRRVFQKYAWITKYIGVREAKARSLMMGKAISLAYETPNCPILGLLARKTLSDLAGTTALFVEDGFHCSHVDFEPGPLNVTLESRHLMAQKFNISVDQQLEIERLIVTNHCDLVHEVLMSPVDGYGKMYSANLDCQSRHMTILNKR